MEPTPAALLTFSNFVDTLRPVGLSESGNASHTVEEEELFLMLKAFNSNEAACMRHIWCKASPVNDSI